MRILHLSMGLPPFRTGGLNRYCADLMRQQVEDGQTVVLLYPGEFKFFKKSYIKQEKHALFQVFRIVNPLPLALTNGVSNPKNYMKSSSKKIYSEFLQKLYPDVIHVHTLQGFPKELFEAAKELGVRMVFTTHDYYPFCLKCVLMNHKGSICQGGAGEKCRQCNAGCGLSRKQEVIMQSRIYMRLKYSRFFSLIRKQQRAENENRAADCKTVPVRVSHYDALLDYYRQILNKMDMIHANSKVALQIYQRAFPSLNYRMVTITHADIQLQTPRVQTGTEINISFLGGKDEFKGIKTLLAAMSLLDKQGVRNWNLWLYGADCTAYCTDERIHNGGYFTKEQENRVWARPNHLLVVPSKWPETFGFVVLEGLAHGVPVICSDMVGAQMLLAKENIFEHDNADALSYVILHHSREIPLTEEMISMKIHSEKILREIYCLQEGK